LKGSAVLVPLVVLLMNGGGKAELYSDILGKRPARGNHPRFDFYLLRLTIQLPYQIVDDRNNRRNIANDKLVGTIIRKNISALGEKLFQRVLHLVGFPIAQHARHSDRGNGLSLGLFQIALGLRFLFQRVPRGHTQHISAELLVQIVILQHDIQSLIPRHFIEYDGQAALNRWIEHHV
jgi:hypothetical protein